MSVAWQALARLDGLYRLDQLAAFDEGGFLAAIAAEHAERPPRPEPLDTIAESLDSLGELLPALDRHTEKMMHLLLTEELAQRHADVPLPQQLRLLFSTTVISYAEDLPKLQARAHAALARLTSTPARAATIAADLVDAARRVLGARTRQRELVLTLAVRTATEHQPVAKKAARDLKLDEPQRRLWTRARLDLEAVAQRPTVLLLAPFYQRLAMQPEPELEQPESSTAERFALLEID